MRKIVHTLPDVLSILRFPLSILFAIMISLKVTGKLDSKLSILIIFMLIIISDLIDGKIARHYGLETSIGSVLDVTADSFYLFISLIVLNYYHIVPIWFTAVIALKLADFIISSRIFKRDEKECFIFDAPGRFAAAGFYIFPALAGVFQHEDLITDAAVILAALAVLSSILRWRCLKKWLIVYKL